MVMDMDLKRESQNEQAIAKLRDDVESALPMIKYIAKLNYEYYICLIDAGFSKDEALRLVQTNGNHLRG